MNFIEMDNEPLKHRSLDLIHKLKKKQLWLYNHQNEVSDYERKYNETQYTIDLISELIVRMNPNYSRKDEE